MKSSELKGYLTGLILGDGTIDKGTTKRAFRIKSINFDFIDKIEKDLKDTTNWNIFVKEFQATNKDGVNRKAYKELVIKANPYFAKIYHFFYDDYKRRVISDKALNWLNPEGLANWFMSDGYITLVGKTKGIIKDRRVEISTDRYKKEDIFKIQNYFKTNYGWDTSIIDRKRGNQYRIRISLLSAQHFLTMIEPYVTESFKYKLNLAYENKPYWMTEEYYQVMLRSANPLTESN